MANARRAHHRRQHRKTTAHDAYVGTVVGWSADDEVSIETAKKESHDVLIEMMGAARTGGVKWLVQRGRKAYKSLDRFVAATEPGDQVMLDHYRQVRAHLREHGGCLIVAFAGGVPAV